MAKKTGRPRIRYCSFCGRDLTAVDADLRANKRECRPCHNSRRRIANCGDKLKTGIPTVDKQTYKREYMRRFRAGQKIGRTPTGRSSSGEWYCGTHDVSISRERDACPWCEESAR